MPPTSDVDAISSDGQMSAPADGARAFGALLLRCRRAAEMSQLQLAQASGMSVRALRELEHGRARAAYRRSADALADALGLAGGDRELFLMTAKAGRRRARRAWDETASCSLPPPVVDRVGRNPELTWLREHVVPGRVVAVVGYPGVGKTVVAAAAARMLAPAFPDGCLAVDLRGAQERPVPPGEALGRLLSAAGVGPDCVPQTGGQQSNLARMLLDGRRLLVLLDNVAEEAQVRPLLAPGSGCATLITSRPTLAGLESVRRLWLWPLTEAESLDLLARIVGADRVDAEPGAATRLVQLCAGLPLALRIVGNRLATRPNWTIEAMVRRLGDHRSWLRSLRAGDLQVLARFEVSYARLSIAAQMVFRRIALISEADFGADLAAVAANISPAQVGIHLQELVDAGLLRAEPGRERRFHVNDLVKAFAFQRLTEVEGERLSEVLSEAVRGHLRACG